MRKTLEAKPMFQYEAEARLGREVSNTSKSNMGFYVCDTGTSQYNWIQEDSFNAKPCETLTENVFIFKDDINKWMTFFRQYTKNKKEITRYEQTQVYLINKYLKGIDAAINKILNTNILNSDL